MMSNLRISCETIVNMMVVVSRLRLLTKVQRLLLLLKRGLGHQQLTRMVD